MGMVYLTGNSNVVGLENGRLSIKSGDEIRKEPFELLEGINIYGKSQITTQCIHACIRNKIPISFYTQYGTYIGGISGMERVSVERQRMQVMFSNSNTALALGKKIINAKIRNQVTVLRRYSRHSGIDVSNNISNMEYCYKNITF